VGVGEVGVGVGGGAEDAPRLIFQLDTRLHDHARNVYVVVTASG
jgi:hypothetical protein